MRCRGCGFVVVGVWVLVLGDRGDCLLGWLGFVKGDIILIILIILIYERL